jgi:Glycosyl transferase family 11
MKKSKYTPKSEINRIFSIFNAFKKDAEDTELSLADDAINTNKLVLTMSSLGQLGRFGNQLFQYAFLRICAEKSGVEVECPPWIGQTIFGHKDSPITKRLPPAIERWNTEKSLFDVIPEFIPYLEKLAKAKSCPVGLDVLEHGLANVDLWGFFQLPTRLLAPHKKYFISLFQPVNELKNPLQDSLNNLRQGKTIVAIHIRRGDYIREPRAGFTLVFPAKWYCEWLDEIWHELENPVLFLCSDDVDSILPEFEKFSPVTWKDLKVKLPENMKDLNIEFYIDFFMLSNCDLACISNSNFSFIACMLNEGGQKFVRPHWDFSTKFTVFDPWDSEPLLWLGGQQSKFFKSWLEVLYITYVTQGISATLKCILFYLPKSMLKIWGLRAYLGYQIQGLIGVVKSFLYTLGWRYVWKRF